MIEQVAVNHLIDTTVTEQAAHVSAQASTTGERVVKLLYYLLFLGSKAVGVFGVDSGEIGVGHLIVHAIDCNHLALVVYLVEQ